MGLPTPKDPGGRHQSWSPLPGLKLVLGNESRICGSHPAPSENPKPIRAWKSDLGVPLWVPRGLGRDRDPAWAWQKQLRSSLQRFYCQVRARQKASLRPLPDVPIILGAPIPDSGYFNGPAGLALTHLCPLCGLAFGSSVGHCCPYLGLSFPRKNHGLGEDPKGPCSNGAMGPVSGPFLTYGGPICGVRQTGPCRGTPVPLSWGLPDPRWSKQCPHMPRLRRVSR